MFRQDLVSACYFGDPPILVRSVAYEAVLSFCLVRNVTVDEILDNGIPIEQPGGHIDCLEKLCKYSNDKQTVDSKTIISPKQLNSDEI